MEVIFWAELDSVKITSEQRFDDTMSEDLIDEALSDWVSDFDKDEIEVGEYGWRIKR